MANRIRSASPQAPSSKRAQRRRVLQGLAALGLASAAPATRSDPATAGGPTDSACASGARWTQRLFVPGDSGYLARVSIADAPLTLRAGASRALPAQIVHGPLAYALRNGERECIN